MVVFMIFSYKTLQILSKLSSLDLTYETSLTYLNRQDYLQEHEFSTRHFKYVLKRKLYLKNLNKALYSIWYGLLLLKSSTLPLKKLDKKTQLNSSYTHDEELKNLLINLHIEACLVETLRNGGTIELIYGIERELRFLGIEFNEFFNAIQLKKWVVKPIVSSFSNPIVSSLSNNSKRQTLIKNFLSTGYFIKRDTLQVIQKLESELRDEHLNISVNIPENLATNLIVSFPFYANISYLKENPFFIIKDKLNFEEIFSILLLTQENFSKSDADYCLQELKQKNWGDFLIITVDYIKLRYPALLVEFLYRLTRKPTVFPIIPQTNKKVNCPLGVWSSITSYQKLRKDYVSAYQSLTTIEEKIELEKAFETIANHLQYNIRQSMLSFFDQKYNSSLMQRSDKCVIVDTELESFFLRKTLKNYLLNMVY